MGSKKPAKKALVQFSTGAGSAYLCYRTIEKYGLANTILLSANTLAEDPDNWRFGQEVWADLGMPTWTILTHGRTPMQVGRDARCVPNNRMAVCSRVLKRDILREHIDRNYSPDNAVILLGFDWTEEHRHIKALPHWEGWEVESPLLKPPYLEKPAILDWFRGRGIEPPRLYAQGFSHANCGGGCVRGGQAQWELLLRVNPDLYRDWEREEHVTRVILKKNVSILRDRRGGTSKPMSLKEFRERLEAKWEFDKEDWGACGCFMDEEGEVNVTIN